MVQNVQYLNGLPSHVTLPFEFQTPILFSMYKMNSVFRCSVFSWLLYSILQVKKRSPKEHPYATVFHHNRASSNELISEHPVHEEHLDVPPPPTVHPPPPPPENAATTHFSGDSQDSSKGYTSISVREPLCHIQPAVTARSAITVPSR